MQDGQSTSIEARMEIHSLRKTGSRPVARWRCRVAGGRTAFVARKPVEKPSIDRSAVHAIGTSPAKADENQTLMFEYSVKVFSSRVSSCINFG